jgi:hypothetical protein
VPGRQGTAVWSVESGAGGPGTSTETVPRAGGPWPVRAGSTDATPNATKAIAAIAVVRVCGFGATPYAVPETGERARRQ